MANPGDTICTIGQFRVIENKKGGKNTLTFNVHYAAPYGISFLKLGFRLCNGLLDAPMVSVGYGRYKETTWVSRRVALDIYDALMRAVESGDWPEGVEEPSKDLEAAINGLLYENSKVAKELGLEKRVIYQKPKVVFEPYKYQKPEEKKENV